MHGGLATEETEEIEPTEVKPEKLSDENGVGECAEGGVGALTAAGEAEAEAGGLAGHSKWAFAMVLTTLCVRVSSRWIEPLSADTIRGQLLLNEVMPVMLVMRCGNFAIVVEGF